MTCPFCASERVVPVLNERMTRVTWRPGNPFRRYCPECERWLKMCSRDEWVDSDDPLVLPADADPDSPTLVPAAQTGFADEADPKNRFACPECGSTQIGYPDACTECGAGYSWNT